MSVFAKALFPLLACVLAACSTPATLTPTQPASSSPHPTLTAQPEITPSPTPEIDTCLVGQWQVEPNTLAAYLMAFISPDEEADFEVLETDGDLQFTFTEDFTTSFSSDAYTLIMDVETPDSNFASTRLQLGISASGSSHYAVNQGRLITFAQDYSLDSDISVPVSITATSVTISHISLTPTNFISTLWVADLSSDFMPPTETPRYAHYQCDAQALSLSQDYYPLIIFLRVNETGD